MKLTSFSASAGNSSAWIDKKWINLISSNLQKFKWVNNDTANCRCPICNDSTKNSRKARGYFFKYKDMYTYKCHNCGASMSFGKFLNTQYPSLHKEYKLDILKESSSFQKKPEEKNINNLTEAKESTLEKIEYSVSIDTLDKNHIARKYIEGRKIPESAFPRILYTENFQSWVLNVLKAEKYSGNRLPKDKRILLPLQDKDGNIFGVQGRSLEENSKSRYITIKKNDRLPKIFGLERIDTTKPVFAVEGPIDSLFLPNCIAFCGGDVNVPLRVNPENVYVLLDNEPRSKDTISRMENAIEKGYNVMFWQISSVYKDINDMIQKGGYSVRVILTMIKRDSKKGIRAKLALASWKQF